MSAEKKLVVSLNHKDVHTSKEVLDRLDRWMRFLSKTERVGMISQAFIENLRKNGPIYG